MQALKDELASDPEGSERRVKKRALQAAEERARRVAGAAAKLAELEAERKERERTHPAEEGDKGETKASTSDVEARTMRMADGAMRLAYNVQVATACGFVIASSVWLGVPVASMWVAPAEKTKISLRLVGVVPTS